ncbi:MAG: hypothetical protein H0X62_04185 [Bacteroidetes bacterium]|nr:hypothetical protein [Bacteroidota bacterium]
MLLTFFCLFPFLGIGQDRSTERANELKLDNNELSSLIQFCMDLPEMQKYYPLNKDGNKKQVNIMQGPLQLTEAMAQSNSERNVSLFNRGDAQPESYFIFRAIEKMGDSVKMNLNYFYNHKDGSFKLLRINMELKKGIKNWEIINITTEGDKI